MLHPKGNKFEVRYISQNKCEVFIDGMQLRGITQMEISESSHDKFANVTLTFMPSKISVYQCKNES